jgi:hypothetical protein
MALLVLSTCYPVVGGAAAEDDLALLDDFSDSARTDARIDRIVVDDSSVGGKSHLKQTFADGMLTAEGDIVPARGQPGWVSLVLLLSATGEPVDLSRFDGVRLRVRVREGVLSITANSTEITNFDYHASVVPAGGEELQEVRLPFSQMKRAWSEQVPLNRATIASISLVAFGLQKGTFAYEVDEIGFY